VCPEKNFITILALRLHFVSKAQRVDWLRHGSWLMIRRHTLRSYGGVSMTAKLIADAASIGLLPTSWPLAARKLQSAAGTISA